MNIQKSPQTVTRKRVIVSLGIVSLLIALSTLFPAIKGSWLKSESIPLPAGSEQVQEIWGDLGNGSFKKPAGMWRDAQGNNYVADSGYNRIQKFDSTGKFLMKFGTEGTGDGQFKSPQGVVTDTLNNIYVVDTGNHCIQKFDSTGNFLKKFGSLGTGDGQFTSPQAIITDTLNNFYVADTGNNRIQKFDSTGKFLKELGTKGQFKSPRGIIRDTANNIFVVDTGNNKIQKFDSTGNFLKEFGTYGTGDGQFKSPNSASLDPYGNIFVVDTGNDRIQKFDTQGKLLTVFKIHDEYYPYQTAIKKDSLFVTFGVNDRKYNTLFISSGTDNRIDGYMILPPNELLFEDYLGNNSKNSGKGQVFPLDVLVGPTGLLYTIEPERIQRFDPQGNYLGQITGGNIYYDRTVMDSKGNLYVHSPVYPTAGKSAIRKYDPQGVLLKSFAENASGSIGITSKDIIVGSNFDNTTGYTYDTTGKQLSTFPLADKSFADYTGILFVGGDDLIYIGGGRTKTYNRIQKYDLTGKMLQDIALGFDDFFSSMPWTLLVTGEGHLSPLSHAADAQGNIYVNVINNERMIYKFNPSGIVLARYRGELAYGDFREVSGKGVQGGIYRDDMRTWYQPPHKGRIIEYPVIQLYLAQEGDQQNYLSGSTYHRTFWIEAGKVHDVKEKMYGITTQKCDMPNPYITITDIKPCSKPDEEYVFSEFRGACTSKELNCSFTVDGPKEVSILYTLRPKVLDFRMPTTTRSRIVPIATFTTNAPGTSYMVFNTYGWPPRPTADDPRWSTIKPEFGTLPVDEYGNATPIERYNYFVAYTKDIDGHISDEYRNKMIDSDKYASNIIYDPYELALDYDATQGKVQLEKSSFTFAEYWPGRILGSKRSHGKNYSFSEGETITIKAIVGQGSIFTGWTGACSGQGVSCTLTMDSDKTTTPIFEKTYSVRYRDSISGYSKEQNIINGASVVSFPEDPIRAGYKFDGWYSDKIVSGSIVSTKLTTDTKIMENMTVYAKWVPVLLSAPVLLDKSLNPVTGTVSRGEYTLRVTGCTGSNTYRLYQNANYITAKTCNNNEVLFTVSLSDTQKYDFYIQDITSIQANSPTLSVNVINPAVNGVCGTTNNTCTAGNLSDTTDSSTQHIWSCTGLGTGTTALCTLDKSSFTVTFDSLDATIPATPAIKVVTLPNKTIGAFPTPPVKVGYTFGGWWKQTTDGPRRFLLNTAVTADTTLTAKWGPIVRSNYAVIYDSQSATIQANPSTQIVPPPNTTVDNLPTPPQKTGYTFDGWYTAPNGEGTQFLGTTPLTSGIVVYAKWTPIVVDTIATITFERNLTDATGTMSNQTTTAGSTVTLTPNTYAKPGYTFAGWSTTPTGSVEYADGASYTVGTGNTTLYARWSARMHTITFNRNATTGVTGVMIYQRLYTGQIAPIKTNTLKRPGYTFAGWSTTPTGPVEYIDGVTYTMGAEDTTLYAVWSAKINFLTFNKNDASSSAIGFMARKSINTGMAASLPTNRYSKPGYTFAGWSTTPTGPVEYTDGAIYTMGAEDTTLYAVWTPNPQ